MAKLPIVLKEAIQTSNWELVCKVYTAITGEYIEPPKTEEEELASMDIVVDIPTPSPVETKKPHIFDNRIGPKPQTTNSTNQFVDDCTLCTEDLKANDPILRQMYNRAAIHERRPPVRLVKAKCQKCGKEEEVSPVLTQGRAIGIPGESDDLPPYLCNRCSKKSG